MAVLFPVAGWVSLADVRGVDERVRGAMAGTGGYLMVLDGERSGPEGKGGEGGGGGAGGGCW